MGGSVDDLNVAKAAQKKLIDYLDKIMDREVIGGNEYPLIEYRSISQIKFQELRRSYD